MGTNETTPKPCPFCGRSEFEYSVWRTPFLSCPHEKTGVVVVVNCKPCFYELGSLVGVKPRDGTERLPRETWAHCEKRAKAAAIAAWNRRATDKEGGAR